MTTAIVHGDPGSRKTATLVGQYGIPALYSGRTVVTNIRGFNSLEKIEKVYGKKLPEGVELISVPFTRDGFKKIGMFFHWAPVGALILMDEGQRVYPTRLRNLNYFDCNPARKTGFVDEATGVEEDIETVEEAFDCHRHMNWDIYISTPNIEKVHKEIRQVAEFGYRQKDLSSVSKLLAFLLGDFKRVKHNAENKGISEGQALSQTNHRINKKVFKCYQSTATGVVKGTHTKASVLGQPKLLFVLLFVGYAIYNFTDTYLTYGSFFPSNKTIVEVDKRNASSESLAEVDADSGQVAMAGNTVPASDIPVRDVRDRNDNKKLSMMVLNQLHSYSATIIQSDGTAVHWVELKQGDDITTLNSDELARIGIDIDAYDNFVIASVGDTQRFVQTIHRKPSEDKTMVFDGSKAPELGPEF